MPITMKRVFLAVLFLSANLGPFTPTATAANAISVEAENATRTAPATVGTDPAASGQTYIQFGAMPAAVAGITVLPGENLQAKIDANPEGTVFNLKPGVYRLSTALIPKINDSFIGEPGAVINGSKDISALFLSDGAGHWVASNQTQVNPNRTGISATASPACLYPDDVFKDNVPLRRVMTLAEVVPGAFYFDYTAQKIYIGENPSGHTIEAAVAWQAFRAYTLGITGVTIRGLVIEKFATEAQKSAIETRSGYTVEYNEIRLNHSIGLAANAIARGNYIHHNGQMGISGGSTGGVALFENNELSFNNTAGYDPNWEAGGSKWSQVGSPTSSDGVNIFNNWVHDNVGQGLWADGRNYNMTYENNLIENNTGTGIFHEISWKAFIRNNVVRNNAVKDAQGMSIWHGANILLNNSQNVEIYGNVVEGSINGIGLIDSDRVAEPLFPQYLSNVYVHDNVVSMSGGQAGLVGRDTSFLPAALNRFQHNTYYVANTAGLFWQWNGDRTWAQWQALGQDTTGSVFPLASAPKSGAPLLPDTRFGAASCSVSVPTGGATYVLWSRLMAPNSVNNSCFLQVNGGPGIILGNGALVPGQWTWVNYRDGLVNSPISLTLAAGTHTLKFIGREPGVKLDRVLLVANGAIPTGTGDNVLAVNQPPVIQSAPWATPNPVVFPNTTTVNVAASDPDNGPAPLAYTWSQVSGPGTTSFSPNGTAASSSSTATFSVAGTRILRVTVSDGAASLYQDLSVTINPAPVAPTITAQPVSKTVTAGQTATFTVMASGTAPLAYQWRKNASNITGATSASYTTPATTTADSGALFSVVVSNSAGSATSSNATLTVNAAPVAPTITAQPVSKTVTAGQTATFSVTATGTAPLTYQWRKNAITIAGATSASYTTPATTTADSGALFSVVVSNSVGSATSSNAILTVNAAPVAPTITAQPVSKTVTAGETAAFSVTASGTAPLAYQWRKNGANIAGATAASYTTPATTTADNGALFSVVVTNSAGSATSNNATLTVIQTVHISSLTIWLTAPTLSRTRAKAQVIIVNQSGTPMAGASVTGTWSGLVSGVVTGLTGADGSVTFTSSRVRGSGTFTFTVTNVSLSGYTYDSTKNAKTSASITK